MAVEAPRVCILSQRGIQKLVSRCSIYEFEDVIESVDQVDSIHLAPRRSYAYRRRIVNRSARLLSWLGRANPGIQRAGLHRSYDLFIAFFQLPEDLLTLNAVSGWEQRAGLKVCWLEELWVKRLARMSEHLRLLSKFDYVVLNCNSTVQPLENLVQRPCRYVPYGVDALRFEPEVDGERPVDVYSVGRRIEDRHTELLRLVDKDRLFYIYDTISRLDARDPSQHRRLVANIAKRSKFFVVNPAKMDRHDETDGQGEIGPRYFEGAAAGAILIGEAPDTAVYHELFNWPEAVVPLPAVAAEIGPFLRSLSRDPGIQKRREHVVKECLRRHDWAYRWASVLAFAGLEPLAALNARRRRLEDAAAMRTGSSPPDFSARTKPARQDSTMTRTEN